MDGWLDGFTVFAVLFILTIVYIYSTNIILCLPCVKRTFFIPSVHLTSKHGCLQISIYIYSLIDVYHTCT